MTKKSTSRWALILVAAMLCVSAAAFAEEGNIIEPEAPPQIDPNYNPNPRVYYAGTYDHTAYYKGPNGSGAGGSGSGSGGLQSDGDGYTLDVILQVGENESVQSVLRTFLNTNAAVVGLPTTGSYNVKLTKYEVVFAISWTDGVATVSRP